MTGPPPLKQPFQIVAIACLALSPPGVGGLRLSLAQLVPFVPARLKLFLLLLEVRPFRFFTFSQRDGSLGISILRALENRRGIVSPPTAPKR